MKKNLITVYLQMLISIISMIFVVLYFTTSKLFLHYLELSLGVDLILMAINNKYFYKRKNFTILYLIFGIVMIGYGILKLLGVV